MKRCSCSNKWPSCGKGESFSGEENKFRIQAPAAAWARIEIRKTEPKAVFWYGTAMRLLFFCTHDTSTPPLLPQWLTCHQQHTQMPTYCFLWHAQQIIGITPMPPPPLLLLIAMSSIFRALHGTACAADSIAFSGIFFATVLLPCLRPPTWDGHRLLIVVIWPC